MRHRVFACIGLIVALSLNLGCDDHNVPNSNAGGGLKSSVVHSGRPVLSLVRPDLLLGYPWRLVELQELDGRSTKIEHGLMLEFSSGYATTDSREGVDYSVAGGCGDFALVTVKPGRINFHRGWGNGLVYYIGIDCGSPDAERNSWLRRSVMTGTVLWSIQAGRLIITRAADGRSLVFERAPSRVLSQVLSPLSGPWT